MQRCVGLVERLVDLILVCFANGAEPLAKRPLEGGDGVDRPAHHLSNRVGCEEVELAQRVLDLRPLRAGPRELLRFSEPGTPMMLRMTLMSASTRFCAFSAPSTFA